MTKGSRKVVFDIVINTPKGAFVCAHFKRNSEKVSAYLDGTKTKVTIHLMHDIFGRMYK